MNKNNGVTVTLPDNGMCAIVRKINGRYEIDTGRIEGKDIFLGPQPDPITGLVPCDFCTDAFDQKPLLQENKYKPYTCMMSTISIEENNGKHQIEIDLWDGVNVYAAFEINYCPMCGRKLTAPPRPGAIGPETGEMAPNGEEGATE